MNDNQSAEKKMKHLELIANVIERMGNNSYQLKGWTVTLITILSAIAVKEADKHIAFLFLVPLITFWLIDSKYLQLERKFRELYRQVANKDEAGINFSMDIDSIPVKETKMAYPKCLFSSTEAGFYGILTIAAIVIVCIIFEIIK